MDSRGDSEAAHGVLRRISFLPQNMVDIFNPFSLINALDDRELRNYWASSGATSLLPKFVDDMEMKMEYLTIASSSAIPWKHRM